MPIYEYVCKDCRTHFEALVSLSSPQEVTCKKCGSRDIRKTVSASCIRVSSGGSSPASGSLPGCPSGSGFS